ncbi:MAG TPA: response regulator [Polyangia bacterium]|nr:response regulator [Polyangia bacterium]
MPHILLIEDDDEVVEFTRQLLQRNDFSLDVAGDGERALVAYMTRRPDAMLLDVFVPRIDGLRFARELAARFPADRVPTVVWTGAADAESMGDLIETPYVLQKPVASAELLETLRRALHLPSRAGAVRVLVAGERLAGIRALVRELRGDFDVQVAPRLDDVKTLAKTLKPRALVMEVATAEHAAWLANLSADRPLPRVALIHGELSAIDLQNARITVARAGEVAAAVRASLR